ncbi:hypothetical protein P4O66_004234 [Electrophorus voltai]|uniref:Uncharacterized protein n=1 Tax=Electrophorus voltai TaxID=2609070 RepID=A0AAD8ZPE9_9TELE|nr:hypothetical protein P4O66_004234 [Electrophorus voltai]
MPSLFPFCHVLLRTACWLTERPEHIINASLHTSSPTSANACCSSYAQTFGDLGQERQLNPSEVNNTRAAAPKACPEVSLTSAVVSNTRPPRTSFPTCISA